jgi:hypothetical protein
MPFLDSLDVANRALQHCGVEPIATITEDSNRNRHASAAYDKLRGAELERNTWRFAIKKAALRPLDTTTLMLIPALYDATKTYLPGEIVEDSNGLLWVSLQADNINNTPGGNSKSWGIYFGPPTADVWATGGSYFSGELVYVISASAPNGYQVFMSLSNANSDTPNVATVYDATVQYKQDDVVSNGGFEWRSLLAINKANTPAVGPAAFDIGATYAATNTVTGSDNYIYSSVGSGNIGNDPTTDGGVHWTNTGTLTAWARTPTILVSSINWRPIVATLGDVNTIYPIGSGPSSQGSTRNVFRLPAGYLKTAPQEPKAGSTSYLGAPSGLAYTDWEYEGDYIVSGQSGPIILRFVADIQDVQEMTAMFCEGLACRIATAICEPLTQSTTKLQAIASEYNKVMGEARISNAIEEGAEEAPIDDYLLCRY